MGAYHSPMKPSSELPLSAKARKIVASQVASGKYGSPKEVMEDALNLLVRAEREREDRLEEIRRGVRRGIEAANRGDVLPLEGVVERVRAKVEARHQALRRRKSA